ncbi:hypothetical protein [Nesterenkonia sp. PF2B19]|uniref:hypothetical protein n=1 Tax=Nesterenkonia sp. PF2B19 TaxID=1881858 RepID=UPI001F29C530|nr:hypothetical protein [Nesterenkonia sp. PF2B19]
MAAVTGESLATLQEQLSETLAASELPVADELFGALDVLDSSAGLRRSLTDPAREAQERAASCAASSEPRRVRPQ